MQFDTNKDPWSQIDENTRVKWADLSEKEQVWLYRYALGRDPLPGEINNQISLNKSVKYFLHGAKNELRSRVKEKDESAVDRLKITNQWESRLENTLFDSISDLTGIDELSNPFGELADITGIDEVEEYGATAMNLAAAVASITTGNPAIYMASHALTNAMYGDFEDVALGLGEDLAMRALAGKGSVFVKAAASGAFEGLKGGDLEDIAIASSQSLLGDALNARFPAYLTEGIPVRAGDMAMAAIKYKTSGDPQAALQLLAFKAAQNDAISRKVAKQGGTWPPSKNAEVQWQKWIEQQAQNDYEIINEMVTGVKEAPAKLSESSARIRSRIFGRRSAQTANEIISESDSMNVTALDLLEEAQ